MLEINGIFYYVDLNRLSDVIGGVLDTNVDVLTVNEYEERKITHPDGTETVEVTTKKYLNPNDSKFKTNVVIDEFLKTVFFYKEFFGEGEEGEEFDDTKEQTSYKLAFNTLLVNGIIKEYKTK